MSFTFDGSTFSTETLAKALESKLPGISWLNRALLDADPGGSDQVKLSLADLSGEASASFGPASFELSGSVEAVIALIANPSDNDLPDMAADARPSHKLLSFEFLGSLEAGLKAKTPFSAGTVTGTIGVEVNAEVASRLQYVFDKPEQQIAREAVVSALNALPAPWDLASIGESTDLQCMSLDNATQLSTGISLSLSRGLDIKSVSGGAQLSASASYALTGRLKLTNKREPNGKIRMILERENTSSRKFAGGLDITLDTQELIADGFKLLRDELGPRADLADLLVQGSLLKPGTLAKDAIVGAIDGAFTDPQIKTLWKAALGESEQSDAKQALLKLVQGRLNLNPEALIEEDVVPTIKRVTWEVLDRLPMPVAAKKLREQLEGVIDEAIEDAKSEANEKLLGLADKLVAPLAKLGVVIDAATVQADELAQHLKPHIGPYGDLIRKLAKASEDAALAKFQGKLDVSSSNSESQEVEVDILLDPTSKIAAKFHRQVVLGDPDPLIDLIRSKTGKSEDASVQIVGGRLQQWIKSVRKSVLGISFLGFNFESTGEVSSSATWTVDRSGNITIETLNGRGFAKQVFSFNDENKIVSFLSAPQLAVLPSQSDTWETSFALTYEDPLMEKREFAHLIQQLRDANLIDESKKEELGREYDSLASKTPETLPPVSFTGELSIPGSGINSLMRRHTSSDPYWLEARQEFARQLMPLVVAEHGGSAFFSFIKRRSITRLQAARFRVEEPDSVEEVLAFLSTTGDCSAADLRDDSIGRAAIEALGTNRRVDALRQVLCYLRGLGIALTNMHAAWSLDLDDDSSLARKQQQRRLNRLQKKVATGMKASMQAGDTEQIIGTADIYSPATLALLFTMARLTNSTYTHSLQTNVSTLKVTA